jgi:HD-like signal output (HDOD) protein
MDSQQFAHWMTSGVWRSLDASTLPIAPGLLGDALLVAGDPDPDGRRLLGLVRHEHVLTARVLRMANSAAVGPMREVTTLDGAVFRLGMTTVRRLVVSLCLGSWTTPDDHHALDGQDFMQHAMGTAYMGRMAGGLAGLDPEEAFVGALLHDIGKLLMVRLRAAFVRHGGGAPSTDEFTALVRDHHAEMGDSLLLLWGIPARLRSMARWHHAPLDAPDPIPASVTWLANALAHRYGFGCIPEDDNDLLQHPIALALGVTPAWLAEADLAGLSTIHEALAQMNA